MAVSSNPRVFLKQNKNGKKLKNKEKTSSTSSVLKTNVVTLELKFVKRLAGNDVDTSGKELKKLGRWLQLRSKSSNPFTETDFLRLWKGLYYCMWMSDKPLVQEKLAEDLASLIHRFDQKYVAMQFFGAFMKLMAREWIGIDNWRIDKFMMLVRRVTRQCLVALSNGKWEKELIKQFNSYVQKTIIAKSSSLGFIMHFIEIFLEEVAKVSGGKIKRPKVTLLLEPFAMCVAIQKDDKIAAHIIKHIFDSLLYQSDLGREYKEKFEAWKQMGFPGTSIDDLELAEDEEEGEEEANENDEQNENKDEEEQSDDDSDTPDLDPRAGQVDVVMPEIPFDPEDIIKTLETYKNEAYTKEKRRRILRKIIDRYTIFSTGRFPLGINYLKINQKAINLPNIDDKVRDLIDFEDRLYQSSRDMKRLNKKKRRKAVEQDEVPVKKVKQPREEPKPTRESLKKMINDWMETDITPEDENEVTKLTTNGSSSTEEKDTETKNTETSTNNSAQSSTGSFATNDASHTQTRRRDKEYFVSPKTKQRIAEANAMLRMDDENEVPTSADSDDKPSSTTPSAPKIPRPSSPKTPTSDTSSSKISSSKTSTPKASTPKTPADKTPNKPPLNSSATSTAEKRVKIMLTLNRSQDTSEYFKQLRSSPRIPFDGTKRPGKGLLKPNAIPSPINPYYKKKLGLDF